MIIKKHALLLTIFVVMSSAGNAIADPKEIAAELAPKLKNNLVIAVQPIDERGKSGAKISAGTASSIVDQLTNQMQRSLQGSSSVLAERAKLNQVMMEQEEFQNVTEYSELVANTGADALVVPSINRINNEEIEVSARAIGVKGSIEGVVLGASRIYTMKAPISYRVSVTSIKQGDKDRSEYSDYVVSGLTDFDEIVVVKPSITSDMKDFDVTVSFDFETGERQTEESRKAAADAAGAQNAMNMFGSMANVLKDKDGNSPFGENPFGGMLSNVSKQEAAKAESLKLRVFTVEARGKLISSFNGPTVSATVSKEETLPFDASRGEQKIAAKRLVNLSLEELGRSLAAKALGKSTVSETHSDSLLD